MQFALYETYQVVELNGSHTLVDAVDDLHGDGGRIDVLWVEAITESRDTGCDLVELDALLAAICEARQSCSFGADSGVFVLGGGDRLVGVPGSF